MPETWPATGVSYRLDDEHVVADEFGVEPEASLSPEPNVIRLGLTHRFSRDRILTIRLAQYDPLEQGFDIPP